MSNGAERPAELPDVQGAWKREKRCIDGGPWEEVSEVLWLQVDSYFCDLRATRPGGASTQMLDLPQAFSGSVEVLHGVITFRHDLDSLHRDPAHPDVSTVHRKSQAMYERGPGFEERWVLSSEPDHPRAVAECSGDDRAVLARIVRVGTVALAVWGGLDPGGALCAERDGWVPDPGPFRLDPLLAVHEAALALVDGGPLPAAWARRTIGSA